MRIGLIQASWDVNGGNTARYDRFAAEAADAGCAVVLFPELSDTGYALTSIRETAGGWPGPALEALQTAAQRRRLGIIAGLSERTAGGIYNSAVTFDRDGESCGAYRKTHLFRGPEGAEADVFRAGDAFQVVTIDGVRWGLSICFDLRFPEVYRQLADGGAQVLAVLAAWPRVRIADWSVLCRARAIENQLFLAGVNHAGAPFGGHSCVIGPDGAVKCEGGDGAAGLLTVDIDLAEIDPLRHALPVLESRRPSLYRSEGA
jgi:predicted amidohydrolase